MSRIREKKKPRMRKIIISIIVLIILITALITGNYWNARQKQLKKEKEEKLAYQQMIKEVKETYSKYMVTVAEKDLLKKEEDKYVKIGKLGKNIEVELADMDIESITDKYYKIKGKDYYIDYKSLNKIEALTKVSDRYKKYIPFNENVITDTTTSFYKDTNCDELLFSINKGYELPVIVKEENSYGVEIENKLVYVLKNNIKEIKENQNSSESKASDVPVLLYHFFHPAGSHPEYETWDYVITLRADKLEKQLEYLKENNFMTLKMKELELFLDGKINIPENSVVLTIDDGNPTIYEIAYPIIEKYQANFTVFNICSFYPDAISKQTEYLEIHSHGYDLHKSGCLGGQGGLIKCVDTNLGIEDLKKSSQMLNESTYFAYPFGEYTQHSIDMLKEAGYTMAFTTEYGNAKIGVDKFLLPRYYVYNGWSMATFKDIVN